MRKSQYVYEFREDAPIDEVGDLLFLAALAAESLHGRSSLRLDGTFLLNKLTRRCTVNAATQVGRDLARIFAGFVGRILGEKSFRVSTAEAEEPVMAEGGAR